MCRTRADRKTNSPSSNVPYFEDKLLPVPLRHGCRARESESWARQQETRPSRLEKADSGPGNLYLENKTLGLWPAMSTAAAKVCLQRARCISLVGDLARQYGAEALVSAISGQGVRGFSTPCPLCLQKHDWPGDERRMTNISLLIQHELP